MAGSGHGPLSCGAPDRSAVVPETSPAAFGRLFARAADCSQGNSPCRHKGSPFLHFALPDPAPDRKHQPLPARRGLSSMALVDRGLSTPPAMTGGAAHHPQSHGQPGRTASPAPPRPGPAFSCQRGGSGLRPVSAPVGALRHLPAALPVRQTVPSPARHWHGCPLPWVDTLRSAHARLRASTSAHARLRASTSAKTPLHPGAGDRLASGSPKGGGLLWSPYLCYTSRRSVDGVGFFTSRKGGGAYDYLRVIDAHADIRHAHCCYPVVS